MSPLPFPPPGVRPPREGSFCSLVVPGGRAGHQLFTHWLFQAPDPEVCQECLALLQHTRDLPGWQVGTGTDAGEVSRSGPGI